MVYHARTETEIEGNPLYNPNRHAHLMQVQWDEKTESRCLRMIKKKWFVC